jgi:RNA-directed DNA polymerase
MNIFEMLCDSLCMEEDELKHLSSTSPHRYKVYNIPKRNSLGKRTIAHPSKELKFIQRYLITILEKKLPIHDAAYAYKAKVSIKDNAQRHVNSKYLLKMDFKDFFPSISPDIFFERAKSSGINFDERDIKMLSGFLFWKPRRKKSLVLSIGAPSSPLISNFIMYDFDHMINEFCIKEKINYTRYADDITFSTNIKNSLFIIPRLVKKQLKELYLGDIKVNQSKTIFSSKKHNRHVTGITLSNNGELSIGRDKKRKISATIHKFTLGLLPEKEVPYLQGLIAHASHIEPDFYERMSKKYGAANLEKIRVFQLMDE